jgi:hypothetical protein
MGKCDCSHFGTEKLAPTEKSSGWTQILEQRGRGKRSAGSMLLKYHLITAPEFELLLIYLASWKAQTRKSIGRANFTANNKRLSNGMICRKYPIAKVIKR